MAGRDADLIAKILRQQRAQGVVMQRQCRVHDVAVPLPQAGAALHISHDQAHACMEQVHPLALPLHQRPGRVPAGGHPLTPCYVVSASERVAL